MAVKKDTSVEGVPQSFRQLKVASTFLNQASDKLNDSASKFNAAIKKLGLGISSWVEFDGDRNPDNGVAWHEDVGYTKIGGKWGLAIRSVTIDSNDPPDNEYWPFSEAPRGLRIKAAPRIPDLVDQLIQDAAKTTKEISRHTRNIDALTEAILNIAEEPAQEAS
jgi:hypothetical protein